MTVSRHTAHIRFRAVSDELIAAHWSAPPARTYHVGMARARLLQALAAGRSGTQPKQGREILVERIAAAIRHYPYIGKDKPYSVAEFILDEIFDKCLPLPEAEE